MHTCLSVQDWIKAWGDPEVPGHRLSTCPRCFPHRSDEEAWLEAVSECADCRSALAATPVDDDEVLDCSRCMESFEKLHDLLDELEHFDPAVASELLTADELLAKLVPLSPRAQVARVTDDLRYQQWGLAQALLRSSRELWCRDPETARRRAEVAVAVAELLDPGTYHPQWTSDLRAKAYAYLANSFRVLAEFPAAERSFLTAEHHLWQGVGSGRCRAQVFSLKASLLVDQRRFVEAAALLDTVLAYHETAENVVEVARTHLKRAIVAAGTGDFDRAAAECARATAGLDPERDRRLFTLARQNSVEYLLHGSAVARARQVFDQLPPATDRWMELRRCWIEGNLHRAEEDPGAARAAYEAARKGFAEEGRHYYAALVSLEEAAVALDEGDHAGAFTMAQEASVLLVRGAARQEALAVLRVLLTAMERGVADRVLVQSIVQRIASYKPS